MSCKKKSALSLIFLILYIFSLCGVGTGAVYEADTHTRATLSASDKDGIEISSRIYETIFGRKSEREEEPIYLIPSGDAFGIDIKDMHPFVVKSENGSLLEVGDRIIVINDKEISSVTDVEDAVGACGGKPLSIKLRRGEDVLTLTVTPTLEDGKYRLGVSLRQNSLGIGTMTFIEPDSMVYGGLGHAVCDAQGEELDISAGVATSVYVTGVKRAENGKPGEICGVLGKGILGDIRINSECGIFGTLDCQPVSKDEAIQVGRKDEVRLGEAEIITTLKNGMKARYTVEITDVDLTSKTSKSFKIRVTDPALLAISGGIVRGMSGSPIIQDGKLIGAVTHVMIADPKEGYGIFIENMLTATVEPRVSDRAA